MIYFKWILYALLNIPMTLYAWIMAGRIAKHTTTDWMLPYELQNYQTPDAFMNGLGFGGIGRGGDRGFYEEHIGKDLVKTATEWMRRNTYHGKRCWSWGIQYGDLIVQKANGVDYKIYSNGQFIGYCERKSGNFTFDNRSGEGSYLYHFITNGEVKAFMYYANIYFTLPIIGPKRLRLKLGWDLWSMSYWPKNTPRMFVCSLGIHKIKE